jgi:hypothetical protein
MKAAKQRPAPQTPRHGLGDAPIESRFHEHMNVAARTLDRFFNKDGDRSVGFVLLVFPFGAHDGRCNYISNGADRRDIVIMMKEQIRKFEGQPDVTGTA